MGASFPPLYGYNKEYFEKELEKANEKIKKWQDYKIEVEKELEKIKAAEIQQG